MQAHSQQKEVQKCYCSACFAVTVVVVYIWHSWEISTMEEARALAGPSRWVTLQVDAPTSCSATGWDLCFGISTTDGHFFEELCFDDDDCGSQYWRSKLELGDHTLRFEGETAVAGWSWKLHDGKVYKPRPADAETWLVSPPDATKGVLAHHTVNEDSLALLGTAAFVDVDFVLPAKDGVELSGGLALLGPAAAVLDRAPTSTDGAFCSDLGRMHENDPYFWASACDEAVAPSGDELFLPITDAQCNATICSDPDTSTSLCNAGNLLAACAVRCCSSCERNCVLMPAFAPEFVSRWSFGTAIAVAILFLLGYYVRHRLTVQDFELCPDKNILCWATMCMCLSLFTCLCMMDLVLEDETSPFWGEESAGVLSWCRLLVLGICACATVYSTAMVGTVLPLPLCCDIWRAVIACRSRTEISAPPPHLPANVREQRQKSIQQVEIAGNDRLLRDLQQAWDVQARLLDIRRQTIEKGQPIPPELEMHLRNMDENMTKIETTLRLSGQEVPPHRLTGATFAPGPPAEEAIEDRLATLSVQEGVPPIRLKAEPTFADSAYRKAYEQAPRAAETTLATLFAEVQILIDCYCRRHGCASEQAQLLAQDLTARLLAQNPCVSSDGIAKKAAMLVWTSNLRLAGGGDQDLHHKTLFLMLNDTIRQAMRPQAPLQPATVAAARIARCINELCVLPRPPPGQYCPADNVRRVFRGGGFDPHHRAFYDSLNSYRTVGVEVGAAAFRIPQYWATSLREDVATRFMRRNSGHDGLQSVLWTILMAADVNMWNAALVESSHFVGEQEYLFVPFSTFVLVQVRWSMGTHDQPHRIEVLARCDNRKESVQLPTAPWA